jgi:hypothetical protein
MGFVYYQNGKPKILHTDFETTMELIRLSSAKKVYSQDPNKNKVALEILEKKFDAIFEGNHQ